MEELVIIISVANQKGGVGKTTGQKTRWRWQALSPGS